MKKNFLAAFAMGISASSLLWLGFGVGPVQANEVEGENPLEGYACRCGVSRFSERFAFADGQTTSFCDIAWSFFVLRSGREITLIDTGFSDPALTKQWGLSKIRSPLDLLAELGIAPSAVTRVILTHLHFDHVDDLVLFPCAKVIVSSREREDYLQQKKLPAVVYKAAVAAILSDEGRTHAVLEREQIDPKGTLEFEVVGGHTAGSSVVHLQRLGVHYVFTGDECYLFANQKEQRPIGVTWNPKQNAAFIARIADPAIVALPSHEPEIYSRYPSLQPENAAIVRIF